MYQGAGMKQTKRNVTPRNIPTNISDKRYFKGQEYKLIQKGKREQSLTDREVFSERSRYKFGEALAQGWPKGIREQTARPAHPCVLNHLHLVAARDRTLLTLSTAALFFLGSFLDDGLINIDERGLGG